MRQGMEGAQKIGSNAYSPKFARRSQPNHAEARGLHAPVYAWFTEGFHAQDLKHTRTLLNGLIPVPLEGSSCKGE